MPICCQCVGEQKYLFFVFVGAGRDTSDLASPFFNTQVALDRDSSDRANQIDLLQCSLTLFDENHLDPPWRSFDLRKESTWQWQLH